MLKILFLGWLAIGFLVLRWANRRIRAHEEAIGIERVGMFGDIVPVTYALAVSVWPIAIGLGTYWVARRTDLARQGRVSLFFGLAVVTAQFGIFVFWREIWWLMHC